MYCKNCGAKIRDDAVFCSNCGLPAEQLQKAQPSGNLKSIYCEQQTTLEQKQTTLGQQQYFEQQSINHQQQSHLHQQMPYNRQPAQLEMKWYIFTIYFVLFAGAVLNILYSIAFITSPIYKIQLLYGRIDINTYRELQILKILYCILLSGAAVLAIIARQNLVHYKALGIKLLYSFYIGNIILSSIYVLTASIEIVLLPIAAIAVSHIIFNLVMIIVNIVYFKKRKAMFH